MSDEFKETPIGKIPKDWDYVSIRDIIQYVKGKKPEITSNESQDGWLPYLSTEYLRTGIPSYFVRPTGKEVFVEPGDILILWDGSNAGEVFLSKGEGILSSTMVKLKIKEDLYDKLFVFYLLKHKVEPILKSQTKGTGIPHVDKKILNLLQIPLPPLPEQKKIAEILSTIDKAIEKTDALIHHYQQLKNALMQKLFTEGIGHIKFKPSPLGQIPAEWDVVKIGDIIEFAQYGLSIKMYDEGQYPIVKMDSIINGKVMPVNLKYVDLDEETFNKFKLEKGDVLVNRTNSYELVGKTGIFMLEGDYVFASYLIRLRPKKDIVDSAFLTYYLILSQDRLRQIATRGVSQANINATNLKKFLVPLPPLEEQKKIAQILMTIDNKIEAEMKTKEELEKLKQGMMDKLLTGKVRVKVGEGSG
ncbi:restriction endonuclease subunit S [Thermococcus sp. GR7]|uniref:restriction endonuclease subunit S n=1 Tax=unclassified Thermococcus TaxID=2627626 RepID=UPI0014300A7D|nr:MULTISPECIES: restriction endonuclease subunit S [unclassified Thermococcus]NJE46045.1 restriction endonuclease subunit S [Thermococcus sp. GR7]NJE79357.1 restriction endonuclease subunit S [Thermococcus sp. GR4]NJF22242.1 restriction endonuclease subunit S [Thermococcus sp. GR5]